MNTIRDGQTGIEKIECDSNPENKNYGSCTITCADGFELKYGYENEIICDDGDWWRESGKIEGETLDLCKETVVECSMNTIRDGQTGIEKIECDSNPENKNYGSCTITCADGFELKYGYENEIICDDGDWYRESAKIEGETLDLCKEKEVAAADTCDDREGIKQPSGCYFPLWRTGSFVDAKAACEAEGATLARFTSSENEREVIGHFSNMEDSIYFWVDTDGNYVGDSGSKTVTWSNGEQYTIVNWYEGGPRDGGPFPKKAASRTHFLLSNKELGGFFNMMPGWPGAFSLCQLESEESGQITVDWLDFSDLEGPGGGTKDYVLFRDTTIEECPQKCLDVGDYFINVATWYERHVYYDNNACLCYADIAQPSQNNLKKQNPKQIMALLPGKEWWTVSTCIDIEHDPFGHHYFGEHDVASSGNPCITWDYEDHYNFFYYDDEGVIREQPVYYRADHFIDMGHNSCRNPTNDPKGPYCFTDATIDDEDRETKKLKDHIEYCDVPAC